MPGHRLQTRASYSNIPKASSNPSRRKADDARPLHLFTSEDNMPRHLGKWVSYLRVSTDRQGQSGLGLEAQRKAVLDFLNGGNWKLAEEFVD